MIRKGRSINERFVLKKRNGAISVDGASAARFGYKLGADDGVWVDWLWDRGRFELSTGPLGFYPVFYHADRHGFGVSNDVTRLLAAGCSPELDDAAIAVFLRAGFYVGDDTPFKAIRALPPGAVMRWDASGFRLASAAMPPLGDGAPPSRGAAVKEYGELFQSTIETFVTGEDERVALPLSGGRDSRHILLALLRAERKPANCVTARSLAPMSNEDAIVASAVAGELGVEHVVLPPPSDLLEIEWEKTRLTSFCADEHSWAIPLRSYLRANSFTSSYDGIGGDVLSAGLFLNEERLRLYRAGKLKELAGDILGPEGYLPKMLRRKYFRRWSRELAVERLIPELEKHRNAPNPVGQFYLWNRTRREIAASAWGILNDPCHVFAPYLSRPVYDFLAALPAAYLVDHSFHSEAIAAYYPEHAHIPYETGALPPTRMKRRSIAAYAWDAARCCLFPGGPRKRVNASFFLPRIVKGLIDARYGTDLHNLFNKAVYLAQLENAIDAAARGAR